MKTSDKELDDLFRSQLNHLDVEPDAQVWKNITESLDRKPKRKILAPFLRIAAGLLVISSVGLLFLEKNNQPKTKKVEHQVAKLETKTGQKLVRSDDKLTDKKDMLLLSTKNTIAKKTSPSKDDRKINAPKPIIDPKPNAADNANKIFASLDVPQKKPLDSNLVLAQMNKVVVPDVSTRLSVRPEDEMSSEDPIKTTILPDKRSIQTSVRKRKGIHNVGDLVNLVMAKVDKRPDKLIEFTSSDDGDNSDVTGINLGFISIKKEK